MSTVRPVLLIDGVCNLCSGTVQFVFKRDNGKVFQFGSLQSEPGLKLLAQFNEPANLDSVILIEDGRLYRKSTAILRTMRHLRYGWPLMYGFIVVPRVLRDYVYDFVGRNRYRWFGKKAACWIPPEPVADRFIDQAAERDGVLSG